MKLLWEDNGENESGYEVWMTAPGAPITRLAELGPSSGGVAWFEFPAPGPGKLLFWVEAINPVGQQPSNTILLEADAACPIGAPTGLQVELLDGRLKPEDLVGGTFTITNGGVFGSLLSTPIVNPPRSAILGMHKVEDRPVAENGQVVIRPMMYVALSYDHRLVDGREAVTFLKKIKECVEDPARILLDI